MSDYAPEEFWRKRSAEIKAEFERVQPFRTSVEVNTSVDWIEIERVVSLARELCTQQGTNPDKRVLDVKNATRGPLGSTSVSATVPAWSLFIEAALSVRRAVCQQSSPSSAPSEPTSSSASAAAPGCFTSPGERLRGLREPSSAPGSAHGYGVGHFASNVGRG